MPLADWLERLESMHPSEIELGLDRISRVLERLALDIDATVFHVAGTNGKGSSVAMLDAILRESGVRTGSYTSPHLHRYNERIAVDNEPVTDAQIVAAFERVEQARRDEPLTYFEFGTLAALVVFVDARVDMMILEIGMGGRLDAVNAIEPTAGLITTIALDHCDWLGDDIEAIAREKAGIMRHGKPVIFASADAPNAIKAQAEQIGAKLLLAGRDFDCQPVAGGWHWQGSSLRIDDLERPALPGEHQLRNAAGVLALLEAAGMGTVLDRDAINRALGRVRLAGRAQAIDCDAHWVLDVAHNPAAAETLTQFLAGDSAGGSTVAIIGMLDDKDVEGFVAVIENDIDHWIAVTADDKRAIEANELGRRIANAMNTGCLVAPSLDDAMARAATLAGSDGRVLVTGSFHVVGPTLDRLYSRPQ